MSVVLARQNSGDRSHEETLHQERCARRAAWDLAKAFYRLKNSDKATFYTPKQAKVMPAPTSRRLEERGFVVDSGASNAHDEQKRIEFRRMMTVKRSRTPAAVLTANWHTREEAQVFVHDLNQLQQLEETPAVLSLGNFCKDHGQSNEWVSGQKPRLTEDGKAIICKTDNVVPLVVTGLSTNPASSSSSASLSQDSLRKEAERATRELVPPASSSSSSSVSERSDEMVSVYVDAIKMSGKKQNFAPMWKKLMKNVDIDKPVSFLVHVYLG